MRTIRYYVVNKTTKRGIYTNTDLTKCEKFLANIENKNDFEIRYKWLSI